MKLTHKLKKESARLFENVFNCISMDNLNIKEHFLSVHSQGYPTKRVCV